MAEDRNEKARKEMMQKMMMQRMGMGGGMPPQKPPTPEELAQQRKARIESITHSLKLKEASIKVMKASLAKVAADKAVLENVSLEKAETEWHKKAVKAEIEELDAVYEEGELNVSNEVQSRDDMQNELKNLQEEEAKHTEEQKAKAEPAAEAKTE
jgi:hypothetical protein